MSKLRTVEWIFLNAIMTLALGNYITSSIARMPDINYNNRHIIDSNSSNENEILYSYENALEC